MVPGFGHSVVSMISPALWILSPYCQTSLSEALEKGGSNLNRSFGAGFLSWLIRYSGISFRQLSGGIAGIGLRGSVELLVGMAGNSSGCRVEGKSLNKISSGRSQPDRGRQQPER